MTTTSKMELLPGEHSDIRVDVKCLLDNAEEWLSTPNTRLGGRTPNELIGTSEEGKIRDILRAAVYSSMA
jgi:uncharacterized protein (DUF2384 family)